MQFSFQILWKLCGVKTSNLNLLCATIHANDSLVELTTLSSFIPMAIVHLILDLINLLIINLLIINFLISTVLCHFNITLRFLSLFHLISFFLFSTKLCSPFTLLFSFKSLYLFSTLNFFLENVSNIFLYKFIVLCLLHR